MITAAILVGAIVAIWITVTLLQRHTHQARDLERLEPLDDMNKLCDAAATIASPEDLHDLLLRAVQRLFSRGGGTLFHVGLRERRWHAVADPKATSCEIRPEHLAAVERLAAMDPILGREHLDEIADLEPDVFLTVPVRTRLIVCFATTGLGNLADDELVYIEYLRGLLIAGAFALESKLAQRTDLAGQVAIASELEAAALTPQTQGKISWFQWAVHVRESSSAHWVCSTYQPSETRTVLLLGQLAASGIAASLLHVAVNVFCEALVSRIGATATPARILQELNRFLWRPTRPIGMSCQVLVFERERRQVTYASAGDFDALRLGSLETAVDLHPQPPLGTAPTANFQSADASLFAKDRFLLWSPGVAGGGQATALSRHADTLRTAHDSTEPPAVMAERVQQALGAGGSVLVVAVS